MEDTKLALKIQEIKNFSSLAVKENLGVAKIYANGNGA
jgi:hypothetical protein